MPLKGVELEITDGITEHSSRVALKGVFANFGDVVACWVPPIDRRMQDRASVRFGNAASAEAAKLACDAGQVFLQGLPVKVNWRTGGGRRVGNSDLGEYAGANDVPMGPRALMDQKPKERRPRSKSRRRSRSRAGRRSRSRGMRRGAMGRSRSRSRERLRLRDRESPSKDRAKGGNGAEQSPHALATLAAPPLESAWQGGAPPTGPPPQGAFSGIATASMLTAPQTGLAGGAPPSATQQPPEVAAAMAAAAATAAVVDPVAEFRRREELAAARAERAKQLKRGPGVAALVQGALKRAQTQPTVSKKPEAEKAADKPEMIEQVPEKVGSDSEDESEEALRKKREEVAKVEAAQRKEKAEREAQERERLEREARERREQAKREAAEAEKALQKKEAETRDQRIKASVEAAKKQQAERAAAKAAKEATESLYADMPQPNLEVPVLNEAKAKEAQVREATKNFAGLPPEDRSKVVFLDVDGVLRPARAGGFDIVEGDAAVRVDTTDFFPSAVKALRHIIERTGAVVVLSSEWRRSEACCAALTDILEKNRMRAWSSMTATSLEIEPGPDPVRSFAERRSREIAMWLREHEADCSGWVVLDDINLAIADESKKSTTKSMGPRLVQTWPLCGLTMGNAKTAVRILNGEMINKVVVERPVAPGGGLSTPMPKSAGGIAGGGIITAGGSAAGGGAATPVPGARR